MPSVPSHPLKRRGALAAVLPAAQPQRHERRIERALRQQPAEQVRDLQGDEECVGQRAGAENGRDRHVAQERESARQQGRAADGTDVARQGHCVRSTPLAP
jgi:hypothetical protein